jgi:hypothetical protein
MRRIIRVLTGRMNVQKTAGPLKLLEKMHHGQSFKAFRARKEALDRALSSYFLF